MFLLEYHYGLLNDHIRGHSVMLHMGIFDSLQVTALYVDQWHSHRAPRPVSSHNGAASPETVQALASGDEAVTGVRARRRLASLLMKKLKLER